MNSRLWNLRQQTGQRDYCYGEVKETLRSSLVAVCCDVTSGLYEMPTEKINQLICYSSDN